MSRKRRSMRWENEENLPGRTGRLPTRGVSGRKGKAIDMRALERRIAELEAKVRS